MRQTATQPHIYSAYAIMFWTNSCVFCACLF